MPKSFLIFRKRKASCRAVEEQDSPGLSTKAPRPEGVAELLPNDHHVCQTNVNFQQKFRDMSLDSKVTRLDELLSESEVCSPVTKSLSKITSCFKKLEESNAEENNLTAHNDSSRYPNSCISRGDFRPYLNGPFFAGEMFPGHPVYNNEVKRALRFQENHSCDIPDLNNNHSSYLDNYCVLRLHSSYLDKNCVSSPTKVHFSDSTTKLNLEQSSPERFGRALLENLPREFLPKVQPLEVQNPKPVSSHFMSTRDHLEPPCDNIYPWMLKSSLQDSERRWTAVNFDTPVIHRKSPADLRVGIKNNITKPEDISSKVLLIDKAGHEKFDGVNTSLHHRQTSQVPISITSQNTRQNGLLADCAIPCENNKSKVSPYKDRCHKSELYSCLSSVTPSLPQTPIISSKGNNSPWLYNETKFLASDTMPNVRLADSRSQTLSQRPIDYTTTSLAHSSSVLSQDTTQNAVDGRLSASAESKLQHKHTRRIWKPQEDVDSSRVDSALGTNISEKREEVRLQTMTSPAEVRRAGLYCRAHRARRRKRSFTISSIMSDSGDEEDVYVAPRSCPRCVAETTPVTPRHSSMDVIHYGFPTCSPIRCPEIESMDNVLASSQKNEVSSAIRAPFSITGNNESEKLNHRSEALVSDRLPNTFSSTDVRPSPSSQADSLHKDRTEHRRVTSVHGYDPPCFNEDTPDKVPHAIQRPATSAQMETMSSPNLSSPVWQTLNSVRQSVTFNTDGLSSPRPLSFQPYLFHHPIMQSSEGAVSIDSKKELLINSRDVSSIVSMDSCSPVSTLVMSPGSPVDSQFFHAPPHTYDIKTYGARLTKEHNGSKMKSNFAQDGTKSKKIPLDGRVRPYRCSQCDKAFTQRCSLESHTKKIHGMIEDLAFNERRVKLYVCEDCGHSTDIAEDHYAHSRSHAHHKQALTMRLDTIVAR
uniref:C2H2-type domain-containing protein n=1 Tax=Biomphalaria glabrata TaxID=6526 RepID=A0A2C9KFG2_BIOGL